MFQASLNDRARVAAELRLVRMREFLAKNIPEVTQAVEHLPGSAKARMALLAASREHLNDLLKEGARDPQSRRQLVTLYRQTADLEASLAPSDLSHYSNSATHYHRAVEELLSLRDLSEPARATLIDLYTRRAMIQQQFGQFKEAKTVIAAAEKRYQPAKDNSPEMKQKAARMFSMRGNLALYENGAPGAEDSFRQSIALLNLDNSPQSRYELARATRLLAMLFAHNQRNAEALEQASRSVTIGEQLLAAFPARDDYRRALAASYVVQAGVLPPAAGRPVFSKAMELASFSAAADPYDVQMGSELVLIATRMAAADHPDAASALARARELTEPLLNNFPKSYTAAADQIGLGLETSRYLRAKGRMRDALEELKRIQPIASNQASEFPKLDSVRKRFQTVQEETGALIEAVARGAK